MMFISTKTQTVSSKKCSFKSQCSVPQVIENEEYVKVHFNEVQNDLTGSFKTNTGCFVVPFSGMYSLSSKMLIDLSAVESDCFVKVSLCVNDSIYFQLDSEVIKSDKEKYSGKLKGSVSVWLEKDDKVDIQIFACKAEGIKLQECTFWGKYENIFDEV